MTASAQMDFVQSEKKDGAGIPGLLLRVRRHWLGGELSRRLRGECGVRAGEGMVVGVSGGADSVALLLGCVVLGRRKGGVMPVAVHVHHHLRDEADGDAAWVEELCRGWGVEYRVEHVYPGEMSGNLSGNARDLRYAALQKVAREVDAPYVAVGHQADDQFETILMGLCRGAGLGGLRGMAWKRELGEGISLIRPLLGVRKGDCAEFCRVAGVAWREDAGNVEGDGVRARLRREVLPVLEELWPGMARRGEAVAASVMAAQEIMEREVERVFGEVEETVWDRGRLRGEPIAVIAAGLRRAALALCPRVGDDLGQDHLLGAARVIGSDERRPKRFDWPGGLVCSISVRKVRVCFSGK